MKTLQAIYTDITLQSARDAVKTCEAEQGIGFFTRDDLLYRWWIHSGRSGEDLEMAVEQLVLLALHDWAVAISLQLHEHFLFQYKSPWSACVYGK